MSSNPDPQKSDLLLAQARRFQEQARIVEVDEEKVKLVIFLLGKDYYAFLGKVIKEIVPVEEITSVPGAPDFILGIINLRGDIEAVLDIGKILGLPDVAIASQNRIVVAEQEGIRSGILVDSVEDVVDIGVGLIKAPLSTLAPALKEFVMGEAVFQKKNVTILDGAKILEKIAREPAGLGGR